METVEQQYEKVIKIIKRQLKNNYPKEEFDDLDASLIGQRYVFKCNEIDVEPTVDIKRITNFMNSDKYCKGIIECWENKKKQKWIKDKIKINKIGENYENK